MSHRPPLARWLWAAFACALASSVVVAQDEATIRRRGALQRSAIQELRLAADSMEGRFVQRVPGSYVFVPTRIGLPQVPVMNPEKVSALAVGLPVRIRGTVDDAGRMTVESYALVRPLTARGPGESAPPAAVERASADIMRTIGGLIQPGGAGLTGRTLSGNQEPAARATRESVSAIVAAYREAIQRNDAAAVEATARKWAEVRLYVAELFTDETQYKAIYGPSDNYAPWRYGIIQQQAAAVVAIGEPGKTTARCSGVLIGPDLVLTAGHCFSEPSPKDPTELEVWFDYAEQAAGKNMDVKRRAISEPVAPLPARWPDVLDKKFGADLPDFAIVRFKAPEGQPLVPNAAVPQCVRALPLARGEPLYVVGYPRGERVTVHDSARVYLPFREFDGDRFFQLRLDVEADFVGKPDHDEVMEQFDKSYEPQTEGASRWRFFRSVLDNFQPRMGIVADTFRGNSGGPVFDHEREQCVAGILISGAPDTGVRRSPTWREHERVLPASAVLDALAREPALKAVGEGIKKEQTN